MASPSGTGGTARARLVRLRVFAAKRDPYPEEEWAFARPADPPVAVPGPASVSPAEPPELPAMNVSALFDELEKWGGAIARVTFSDKADVPFRMVVAVDGREEVAAISEALDALEEAWADAR